MWFEGKPVYDEDDEFVAIAGYVREITERKQYKRQLEHTNDRLETFNSFLSHDLKNQLQVAKSYLDIAQDDGSHDALDQVGEVLDRMNEMTTEVLELPRLGFDTIERDAVSLRHLAEDVWNSIDSEETELLFEEDVTLDVDDGLFRNVLENLFRNAVVHNETPVTVRIGSLSDAEGFYLQDDGDGVPPAERESIFEFGYSTSGSGIGLALVREIVEIHDGTISVGDAESGGARFEIQGITPA